MGKPISFEQFEKSCYHTSKYVVAPLLNPAQKVDKAECFTRGRYDAAKVRTKLREIYDNNLNKLNG